MRPLLALGWMSAVAAILCGVGRAAAPGSDAEARHPAPADRAAARAESLFRAGRAEPALVLLDSLGRAAVAAGDRRRELASLLARARILGLTRRAALAEPVAHRAAVLASTLGDSAGLERALRWQAVSMGELGRIVDAERLWQRLLAVSRARSDAEYEGFARLGLGFCASVRGDVDAAVADYGRAAERFETAGVPYWQAWALTARGGLEADRGNLEEARRIHQSVLEVSRRGGVREYEAHARNNLGTLDYLSGDPARALEWFVQARALQRANGEAYGALVGTHNVVIALRDLGRYDDAVAIVDSALAECRELGFRDREASLLLDLGELRRQQGRPREAVEALRLALAVGETALPQTRMESALALAAVLWRLDRAREGVEVVERLERELGARLPFATRSQTSYWLGRWYATEGRLPEALERFREAARVAAEAGTGRYLIEPLTSQARTYRLLGQLDSATAVAERATAVWVAERHLASDPEWRERYAVLCRDLHIERARLRLEYPPGVPGPERSRRVFDAVQAFKARTLLERMTGRSGTAVAPREPADLSALQAVLDTGEVFVDLLLGGEVVLLSVVTRASVEATVIPANGDTLARRLAAYTTLAARRPVTAGGAADDEAFMRTSRAVGDFLLGAIPLPAGATRVLVSPDGACDRLPFACLAPGPAGTPLMDAVVLAFVPSATVLVEIRQRRLGGSAPARGNILALGDPAGATGPLAGARREVRWLATRFRDVHRVEAGGTRVARDLGGYDVLHLAAHGEVDDQHPWRSAIHVPAGTAGKAEPWLRASDVAAMRLDTRLAVLSSCESAGGRVLTGEGVLGLTGAFLAAGAGAVVATLWPVDDATAERFVREFYRALESGEPAGAALRHAQQRIRDRPATRAPYHWAGFVLVGDPATSVRVERRSPFARPLTGVLALVGMAAVAAGVLWWRRRGADPRMAVTGHGEDLS